MDDYTKLMEAGWRQLQTGQGSEAEQSFRAAGRYFPQAATPHGALGYLYLSQGRWEEARQEFEIAAQINPRNPALIHGLARAYSEQDKESEYALILDVEGDTPRNAGMHGVALGLFAAKRGDMTAALHHYRRAQDWFPDSILLSEEIGTTLIQLNQIDEARDMLDRASRKPDVTARLYGLLGDAERRLGNHNAALCAYRAADGESPNSPAVLLALAKLEARLGHWRLARQHFRQYGTEARAVLGKKTDWQRDDPPAFRSLSPDAKRAYIRKAVRSNLITLSTIAIFALIFSKKSHENPWEFFGSVVIGSYLGRLLIYLQEQWKRRRRSAPLPGITK